MEDEAKADKERVIKLDDEQVTREQLIDIVRQCVKDSLVAGAKGGGFKLRQAGDDGAAAAAAAAAGGVTEEDVIRAADMLLDQCGEDRVEEEEEEDFASLTEARVPPPLPLVTPAGGGRAWRRRMRAECESGANVFCPGQALDRMLAGQQRLVDGQRLVVEGQQRVVQAERRIEEMHATIKALLGEADGGGAARRKQ